MVAELISRDKPLTELPPFPDGWYFLARSDELRAGQVLTRRLCGEDVVLWRGESGKLAVVRPHCPHLGAHLGHGSRVAADQLRCPMHGLHFDATGRCTRASKAQHKAPKIQLDGHRFAEHHGVILAWYASDGRAPSWEVPDRDVAGFSSLHTRTFDFRGHPQETTENSVDLAHLDQVHTFLDAEMIAPLHTEGPYLRASFTFSRRADYFGRSDAVRAYYTAHIHGLGYSFVDVTVPAFGLRTQQYVFATPTDAGRLALTIGIRAAAPTRLGVFAPIARTLPARWLSELAASAVMFAYAHEVSRDVAVWEHKRYRPTPRLAQGDGPIGAYRRWARQFYAAAPPAQVS